MKSPVLLFGYEINKQKCKWSYHKTGDCVIIIVVEEDAVM